VTITSQPDANQFDTVALEYDFMAKLFHSPQPFINYMTQQKTCALDLGCGSGLLVTELAKHYRHVIGVDMSYNMLEIAHARRNAPNIDYILADIEQLSLPEQFDYIISKNVFHHVTNIAVIIARIKSWLKPGGRLMITDVISSNPTPPQYVYRIGAIQEYIPNVIQYGLANANRVYRFRTSKHWLNHLASDQYLSEKEFRCIFEGLLPSCTFPDNGFVIWDKVKI